MALDDDWMEDARCRGMMNADAIFFPKATKRKKADFTRAKAICVQCPVQNTCLAYSIAHGITYGCWGGLEPRERKRIPRQMKVRFKQAWWRLHPLARPGRNRLVGGR